MSEGPGGGPGGRDAKVVEGQLGRPARGRWSACARCRWGYPTVIAVAPSVEGKPFPTTFWLTCPWLTARVDEVESASGAARWTARIASDALLRERVLVSDRSYRQLRREMGAGEDPCGDVGVAGQADPLVVKCLHARVAAALCAPADPVGALVLGEMEASGIRSECEDARCREHAGPPGAGGLG